VTLPPPAQRFDRPVLVVSPDEVVSA